MPFNKNDYSKCRTQLDAETQKMKASGCVKNCTDTEEMKTAKTSSEASSGTKTGACTQTINGKPTTPTLCSADNANPAVYSFYPMTGANKDVERIFSVYYPQGNFKTSKTARPVVLKLNGYGYKDNTQTINPNGQEAKAADTYGFALIDVSSPLKDLGGYSLEFPNNGIANDANPTPCKESDSRDFPYLAGIMEFIATQTAPTDETKTLDKDKVFTMGFSQEAMFAVYIAICFSDRVAGVWQGGSGLAKTGWNPVVDGYQAQCTFSSHQKDKGNCCAQDFCKDCRYWPVYPKTCGKKLVHCLTMYTNDSLCGSDHNMYEAATSEGHDARLFSFSKNATQNVQGGHKAPENEWAWKAGCLGLSTTCTSACETSFNTCITDSTATKDPEKFEKCEVKLHKGELNDCKAGCSPSLAMLQKSESPVVSLSKGKFGTASGLATVSSAPAPKCDTPMNWFGAAAQLNKQVKCKPSAGVLPETAWELSPANLCATANYPYMTNSSASISTKRVLLLSLLLIILQTIL